MRFGINIYMRTRTIEMNTIETMGEQEQLRWGRWGFWLGMYAFWYPENIKNSWTLRTLNMDRTTLTRRIWKGVIIIPWGEKKFSSVGINWIGTLKQVARNINKSLALRETCSRNYSVLDCFTRAYRAEPKGPYVWSDTIDSPYVHHTSGVISNGSFPELLPL